MRLFGLIVVAVIAGGMAVAALAKVRRGVKVFVLAGGAVCMFGAWLFWIVPIDGRTQERMAEEARVFVDTVIAELRAGRMPRVSRIISDGGAEDIKALVNNLPDGDYEVEQFDASCPMYYFRVRFEADGCFYCAVEATDVDETDFALFIQIDCKLRGFDRADCDGSGAGGSRGL